MFFMVGFLLYLFVASFLLGQPCQGVRPMVA
jgi:hypothetical protein